jgi:hypothetical protein
LIHAARAVVKNNQRVGDDIRLSQFNDEIAATAASGAGRKIGVKVDGGGAGRLAGRLAIFLSQTGRALGSKIKATALHIFSDPAGGPLVSARGGHIGLLLLMLFRRRRAGGGDELGLSILLLLKALARFEVFDGRQIFGTHERKAVDNLGSGQSESRRGPAVGAG